MDSQKIQHIVLSSIFAWLVFFSKQNFGAVMVGILFITLLASPKLRTKKMIGSSFLGLVIPSIFYGIYLYTSGSFYGFLNDFYVYTIQRIVIEQTLTTPFLYEGTLIQKIVKGFFYTVPLLFGIAGIFTAFEHNKKFLFLPLFVCLFYLVGIRPTTDYIHLSPLLSLVGIPFIVMWESVKRNSIKFMLLVIAFGIVFIGIYSAMYAGYYKWEPPLYKDIYFSNAPKLYVFLDDFHKYELEQVQRVISQKTHKNESIYVYAYLPLLYFVTDRKNPTPYDLIEPTDFYTNTDTNVITNLKKSHNRLVITNNMPAKTTLGEYIEREYNITEKINGFFIWEKVTK
jgi:hypothetical protein